MSTIASISTAPGIGGIGIIRMSGKDTFTILDRIFEQKNKKEELLEQRAADFEKSEKELAEQKNAWNKIHISNFAAEMFNPKEK